MPHVVARRVCTVVLVWHDKKMFVLFCVVLSALVRALLPGVIVGVRRRGNLIVSRAAELAYENHRPKCVGQDTCPIHI